jgi:anti-sigma regulatory factor (Ser/Thr protein kinase)
VRPTARTRRGRADLLAVVHREDSFGLRVDPGPDAPAYARDTIADRLADRLGERTLADLTLLVSELVTNSVIHGGAPREPIDVRVEVGPPVRVEVVDRGNGFATARHESDELGGWGLLLVEELSERWGISRGRTTRVWFELTEPS